MKNQHPNFWSTPTGWAALALIAAVTYFLVVADRNTTLFSSILSDRSEPQSSPVSPHFGSH